MNYQLSLQWSPMLLSSKLLPPTHIAFEHPA